MLLEIPLNYSAGVLYRQLAEHLEKMIATGSIAAGERLPGTRELARMLRVSRCTVVAAYDLLAEKGVVVQTARSGTYATPLSADGSVPHCNDGQLFRFDIEQPTRDLIPLDALAEVCRALTLPSLGDALEGSPPEGLPSLRRLLLRHSVLRGIPARSEELVVTAGGKDALSTALRSFRELGYERLWAEEFSYGEIASMTENEGVALRTLPLLEEENVSEIERLGAKDVLYLVPSFQNPTGRTLSHALRRRILALRSRLGFLILEDDSYGELRYGPQSVPALKAMDDGDGVLYVGSFSQVLFPGMRLGYTLLPPPVKNAYLKVSVFRQGHVSSLVQLVVCRFLEDGGLIDAVERARGTLSSRMETLYRLLQEHFPATSLHRPEGGVYLWFPTGETGTKAASLAARHGVRVSPGVVFSLKDANVPAVRFSITAVPESSMREAVHRLARAWDGFLFNE